MGVAMGQPLQDVSDVVLKKVNSKHITNLSKYHTRDGAREITSTKLQDNMIKRQIKEDGIDYSDLSREVTQSLINLNTGSGTKMSLLKMEIIKCDEATSSFKRLRNCLHSGDLQEAMRLVEVLEDSNYQTLGELQGEISEGINLIQNIERLSLQLRKEKKEI
jgi:hypothetical protein